MRTTNATHQKHTPAETYVVATGDDALLSPIEVAHELRVSLATLARWRGQVDHGPVFTRIYQRVYYRHADVQAFIRSRRFASAHQRA